MRGLWHFPAIACVLAILYSLLDMKWLGILFILWLLWLKQKRNLDFLVFTISLISFVFFASITPIIPDTSLEELEEEMRLTGTIEGKVKTEANQIQFTLDLTEPRTKLLVTHFPEKDEDYRRLPYEHALFHGAVCTLDQIIEIPSSGTNPAQFDFRQFLLQKQITHQAVLADFDTISCEAPNGLLSGLYKIRTDFIQQVEQKFSNFTAAWINAIVFGDASGIDDEINELFQRYGLSHIMAISGTHITLVIAFLYVLLVKGNLLTKEKAHWFFILFLPVYSVLAGANPPVLRAASMMVVLLLLQKYKLKLSYSDLFSILLMVFILWEPFIIYNVGFQFSFAVTFSILLSQQWIKQTETPLWNVFQISFVAQMAILPLQIYYFNLFQPVSIGMNLIIIPFFTFLVIPLMYIFVLIQFFPVALLYGVDSSFIWLQEKMLAFVMWADRVLPSPIYLDKLSVIGVVLYYLGFFLFMSLLARNRRRKAICASFLFIMPILTTAAKPYWQEEGIVTMFDMGQGDAILIEAPYHEAVVMIDAGSAFQFEEMEPARGVYKNIVRSYFHQRGIKQLDALILTHEDMDHIGSVFFILEEVKVKEVIVSPYFDTDILQVFQHIQPGLHVTKTEAGQELSINDALYFRVLAPSYDTGNANENSLVLYANLGINWLFTGDISQAEEEKLVRSPFDLNIDVLKVAHHGSNSSSGETFIQAIQPQIALISVGRNNRYGHPHEEVLDVLKAHHVTIYRTDRDGAIQFFYREEGGGTFSTFLP